jgi:hypothetical protein
VSARSAVHHIGTNFSNLLEIENAPPRKIHFWRSPMHVKVREAVQFLCPEGDQNPAQGFNPISANLSAK